MLKANCEKCNTLLIAGESRCRSCGYDYAASPGAPVVPVIDSAAEVLKLREELNALTAAQPAGVIDKVKRALHLRG